jgi:CheY-like chemotaxis protein
VSVQAEEVFFASLLDMIARPFRHEAENRRLNFEVKMDPNLTRSLVTDSKRLQQVLKNLLSNAFKFTEKGGVRLSVFAAEMGWSEGHPVLARSASVVAFEVTDTGIGIPPEKQRIIFEAFQQADAGTSRKYGGTGLGLAISRELAGLLGGEIQLRSTPDEGSTFTLYLPQTYVGPSTGTASADAKASVTTTTAGQLATAVASKRAIEQITVKDDRENLQPDDATLLIVEDDPYFATVLCDLAREKGFKVLVATRGAEALALAQEFHPTAVSLDVFLPDMLGWTVLNHLKQDPRTRHIPIQMLTLDEDRQHGLARGAFSYVTKPATPEQLEMALSRIKEYTTPRRKRLLVVEDNPAEQLSIRELLGYEDIDVELAATGSEALAALDDQPFDCVVLDLRLPDMSGFEILERFRDTPMLSHLPVVVFTGKDLSPEEDARLHMLARSVVVKGVESPERLLDETALFLHRVVTDLPVEKQKMLDLLHHSDEALVGKKVLVVDDDVRNIFALSSVLERRGMSVLTAGTGREAIATLESTSDVAIVLMDIMMPDMDGYETMQIIRRNPSFRRLPIVALTAKAMKGDREKCLEAGASEYLAKPVNTEQLLSALRMWFHR